jgi:hypothetical protein
LGLILGFSSVVSSGGLVGGISSFDGGGLAKGGIIVWEPVATTPNSSS